MKFILVLISMMFAFALTAISIDFDVGVLNTHQTVYVQPEKIVGPVETVISLPVERVKYMYRQTQTPLLNWESVKEVDVGSINRFVLEVKHDLINDMSKIYNGFNFGCVNKLL